ncbi:MAG: GlxA family transcriptional regulator [Granulosicoccus sp.]
MRKPIFESVHLLVLPHVHLMDLAGPAQVFCSQRLALDVRYISPSESLMAAQGLSLSQLEPLPGSVSGSSCLLVIGSQSMADQLDSESLLRAVEWLKGHADEYQCIAAVCSGSLVLAKAGLLDNLRCTTHHELVSQLKTISAKAKVEENCLFVEDGKVLTSAGITTGIDLSLYLVGKCFSPTVAQGIARDMVVYQRCAGNSKAQSFWLQHRNHVLNEIHLIQDMIMQSPGNDWRLSQLAAETCLSERQFRRRFQQATGETVQEYLQSARLELSRQLLQQTSLPVSAVAERCGFADERSLRRLWQKKEGQAPSDYRRATKM